jgi:hypothetical protein
MVRQATRRPSDTRISDHIGLGVLTAAVPAELVDAILADTGWQRQRPPPARVVVRNRRPARRHNLMTVAGQSGTVQSGLYLVPCFEIC